MYQCDGNLLLWWNFITVIKFITLMIYHIYPLMIWGLLTKQTNFAFLQIASYAMWWRFITLMNIYHFDEIYHFDDLSSTLQSDQLCFSKFDCILPFWYFPGCVVGGWVEEKSRMKIGLRWSWSWGWARQEFLILLI